MDRKPHAFSSRCRWIGGGNLLRREFSVPRKVAHAELRICGLGLFEAVINGRKVGDHVLEPVQTDYDRRSFYRSYPVTELLRPGRNALGVMLGSGFFAPQLPVAPTEYDIGNSPYGEKRLWAELGITAKNGKTYRVVSDDRWQCADGPITQDHLYAGEHYDARREIPDWAQTPCRFAAWRPVRLLSDGAVGMLFDESDFIQPNRIARTLAPVAVHFPRAGTALFDFGENIAGWVELTADEPRGAELTLRFAEELDGDGDADFASTGVFATGVVQTDRYLCRGGGECWQPRFTSHGFRYVEVTGWRRRPTDAMLRAKVIHTDVAQAGGFHCDHPFLNTLYAVARRTWLGNLQGVPTDCPARERCGWLGDVQAVAEFALCNFDAAPALRKYLGDIRTSASPEGWPTMIAPGKRSCGPATPDWATTCIQLPWYLYLYTGDPAAAAENYPFMRRYFKLLRERASGELLTEGLGDWCPPGSCRPTETSPALTSSAYYYLDAQCMAKLARTLGFAAEADEYSALAERIGTAFRAAYYRPTEHSFGSQTANAFALHLGLTPPGEADAVAAALAADLIGRKHHFTTGITGLKYLFQALCDHGYADEALAVLTTPGYPGFRDLIETQGATTLWETWERDPADEPTPRSRNHPMQAGFATFFHQALAGIRPCEDAPGFRKILLAPAFPWAIGEVSAWQQTAAGHIECAWRRRSAGEVELTVKLPPGTAAAVRPPRRWRSDAAEAELPGGGIHTVRFRA